MLVPPHDADAAARALTQLAADAALRTRLGAAAHARILERFTEDAVGRSVGALYRSLLK
jgi:glycosyltransferase involved in cell wall biosynthesis